MQFLKDFEDIETEFAEDNDRRAEKIEEFLIAEAVKAEVMTKKTITANNNPNKWEKTLAPWYNEECREAKRHLLHCRHTHGSTSPPALKAYKQYRRCCVRNRAKLQLSIPDILKYKPKQFWKMLKSQDQDLSALNPTAFADYNSKLFHDTTIPEEEYTPIAN